jgi:peptide/nickel transport system permease protein
MAWYVVRRLALAVPVLFGVSLLVFLWVRALPGGPAQGLLGERADPAAVEAVERQYGLDRPVYEQYGRYVGSLVRLEFGQSITSHQPVLSEIARRFPATAELAAAAMLFAVAAGVPLGVLAAKRRQTWVDQASLVGSLIGISIPIFFLALLLKYVFAVRLGWLPSIGRLDALLSLPHPTNLYTVDALLAGDWEAFADVLRHLLLPAIALGTIPLAIIARITRAAVLDVISEDYVRTARAKGIARRLVDRRHILRNALLPVSTVVGLQTGLLLSGAVLTETVFAWGGIGTWIYDAIRFRDYPVLQGGILFLAVLFLLVNLLVDLSYALIDPRVRYR